MNIHSFLSWGNENNNEEKRTRLECLMKRSSFDPLIKINKQMNKNNNEKFTRWIQKQCVKTIIQHKNVQNE